MGQVGLGSDQLRSVKVNGQPTCIEVTETSLP